VKTKPLSLVHLIREPMGDAEGPPPLLLLLHGVGSHEGDLLGLAPQLDERFFIVSARAPITLARGSYAWYHVTFGPTGPVIDPQEAEDAQAAVLSFIDEALEAYNLSKRKVYLLGFSQGAILSLSLALTHPEKLAGVVAASGRTLPQSVPRGAPPAGMEGLPVFIAHGTRDNVLPVSYARESRDIFARLPAALTYREYAIGHGMSQECLEDISGWLSALLNSSSERDSTS
jgi:phospholipase/carboxylesterase